MFGYFHFNSIETVKAVAYPKAKSPTAEIRPNIFTTPIAARSVMVLSVFHNLIRLNSIRGLILSMCFLAVIS